MNVLQHKHVQKLTRANRLRVLLNTMQYCPDVNTNLAAICMELHIFLRKNLGTVDQRNPDNNPSGPAASTCRGGE